jgi:hypothetical protein
VLLGIGGGFSQQPFFQLWSGEMFPTHLRSTAQDPEEQRSGRFSRAPMREPAETS